jgi:TolB-like protein
MICGLSVISSQAAGQVVTQQERDWAKQAIAAENTLAAHPDKNSLVILYFVNLTGRKDLTPLEKGMTLMLLTDLSLVPEIQLVERVKLQALAEELKLGSSGLVDQQTAPRIGKLVGARTIVGGDFLNTAQKGFDTRSRLLDVETANIKGQFSVSGDLEDILKTEKELVTGIVDKLQISLKPEVAAAIRKPCSVNLKALDAMFRGVDASDRGDYKQAGDLYEEALIADPEVCVAAVALQELVQMGAYSRRGSFNPRSALEETAQSVSSQTSLTNPYTTKKVLPNSTTTPVTIRANFP